MHSHLIALAGLTRLAQLPDLDARLRVIVEVGADMAAAHATVQGATPEQIEAAVVAGGKLAESSPAPAAPARPCRHQDNLYGRCAACGMTWAAQAAERQGRR